MKRLLYTLVACASVLSASAQNYPITTEYFFDHDPGFGHGYVAGTTENGTQDFKADLSKLKQGFHTLNVRGNNVYGWSHTITFQFVLFEKSNNIVGTEYFFDQDPGKGKGVFSAVTGRDTAQSVKQNAAKLNVVVAGIDPGYHILNVRAMNADKTWSDPISSPFVYLKSPEVAKRAEYFFDHDPGEGNGNVIKTDGNAVAFPLETSDLNDGNHILYIRTQDDFGNWNMEEISPFTLKKVQDNAKADWSIPAYVSPNPAQYSFSIQFGKHFSANDSVTVVVSSQSGKELSHAVYAVVNNMITISTAPYSTGSYLVTISKDWLSTSKRLIIKKKQD